MRTFVRDYDHDAVVITVNGEEIASTQLHPFWVIEGSELEHRPVREHLHAPPEHSKLSGRWVDAVDLRPGDTVFLQATGPARIEAVRTDPANYPVYNFAVDGLKCYTVGRNSVLVHNSNGVELPVTSRIKESNLLVRNAESAGRSVQNQIDHLIDQLRQGNLNPGIGTRPIGSGISEARAANGARVYFRQLEDGTIELLGKSTKSNQDAVICTFCDSVIATA